MIEGNLAGVDTTIIVQFFGTKYADTVPVAPIAEVKAAVASPIPILVPAKVLVSPFNITRSVSLGIMGLLLFVLVIDGIFVSKRRIARIAGRTFAHIAFLGMILAIALILKAGKII